MLRGQFSFVRRAAGVTTTFAWDASQAVSPLLTGFGEIAAHNTVTWCLSGNLGALVGFTGSVCFAASHLHEFGVTATYGGGGEFPAAFGASLQTGISNARHICELGGVFNYAGGSILAGSGDYQWDDDTWVASAGAGVGVTPGEIHGGQSNTLQTTLSPFSSLEPC